MLASGEPEIRGFRLRLERDLWLCVETRFRRLMASGLGS